MSKLNTPVYLIENDRVVETTIGDCSGYIDETTTPRGVGPRMHLRGADLWTWGHQGNSPEMVRAFDTETEAQDALEESFVNDFWNCDIAAFPTREAAEQALAYFIKVVKMTYKVESSKNGVTGWAEVATGLDKFAADWKKWMMEQTSTDVFRVVPETGCAWL